MTDSTENETQTYDSANLVSFADQRDLHISRIHKHPANRLSVSHSSASRLAAQRVVIQTSNAQVAARVLPPSQIMFDRGELNEILRVYGFKVAAGEWRDYAIDHLKDRAVFSVFRKSSEIPMFRIEKNPKLARKQGAYSVVTVAGVVLKRGADLRQVLRVFDKKTKLKVL
jgi:hypothetical protein